MKICDNNYNNSNTMDNIRCDYNKYMNEQLQYYDNTITDRLSFLLLWFLVLIDARDTQNKDNNIMTIVILVIMLLWIITDYNNQAILWIIITLIITDTRNDNCSVTMITTKDFRHVIIFIVMIYIIRLIIITYCICWH